MRLLALRAGLRSLGMVFKHAGGYRDVPCWEDREDRRLIGKIHSAMLEELDEDDLRQMLLRLASFGDPRAIDIVVLV